MDRHSKGDRRRIVVPMVLGLFLLAVPVVISLAQNGSDPTGAGLRQFIDRQVGGIDKFMVPATDAAIPTPLLPDGSSDPLYKTTEAKRYLGKQLFHDPVRMVRIKPEFGGVPATSQNGSCDSCHLGEAASRSGTLFNFAAGGEGRGYTDASGKFTPRRRPNLAILPKVRQTPLFPGDPMVDELPTLTDIYENAVGSPARGRKLPDPGKLVRTGRLDALDSVARNVPSIIGFAFNNRLLLGGFAGEPDTVQGALNPMGTGAGENLTLLLLDAHRMLEDQSAELLKRPIYIKLFREAFPEEAAKADAANDMKLLINDVTVLRATSTFLRTVVTRKTAWDGFLSGNDTALTDAQQRGAKLFFTSAKAGGAGCASCHSGPMLNKQANDPDITGVGTFVEENFVNLGLSDHPLQALNKVARKQPNFRDDGRKEITFKDSDAFKFRVLTLRQLKDGGVFFHNGSMTSVKDVVRYFNAGVPQDAEAGAAGTLSTEFTFPRGPGTQRGLGLSDGQVNDLTDFLENGLYDSSFAQDFEMNERDFNYSQYHPDLMALGAKDGRPASGLPVNNNDALSRRDMGLEFLDVTKQVSTRITSGNNNDTLRLTNSSSSVVDTHLLVILQGLPKGVTLTNASGMTKDGDPYLRVFLTEGVLNPGKGIRQVLRFKRASDVPKASYTLKLLSGQGNP
jgi:Di-haem cytochrome c peroxidase